MSIVRVALANLRFPASPDESITLATQAIAGAAKQGAQLICFPECYVPGYRLPSKNVPRPDRSFLDRAWSEIAAAARAAGIAVILGTERLDDNDRLLATALVINSDGTHAGYQDKVQLDPSEDDLYSPGEGRRVFHAGALTFGIAICHEGWRYPETVRWAVRNGAQCVFHPHFHQAESQGFIPTAFGDPRNTFHERAVLCRAAENTCYFASVNYASSGSSTSSAVASPDGTLLAWQPYGEESLLLADLDLAQATGLLAQRYKPV